jgi:hypothetical protein
MRPTNAKSKSLVEHGHLACLCIYFICLSSALASVDVCQDPTAYSHLSIALDRHSDSTIDQVPGAIGQENRNFDLIFSTAEDDLLFGAGHRYTIFDIDPLQPGTNGHLHTFYLPLHKLTGDDRQSFRASFAPALSASSNVFDNRSKFSNDAVQFLAALVWSSRFSDRTSLRYGICGDHRFGDYQVYPVLSVQWQAHPDWAMQLGFPTSWLSYQISKRSSSMLRIMPDGNEWYVLDRSLSNPSRFVYESYALEWDFNWELRESFTITASVGRQFDNRFEMTLVDQSRVRLSSDTVTRVGVALEWNF